MCVWEFCIGRVLGEGMCETYMCMRVWYAYRSVSRWYRQYGGYCRELGVGLFLDSGRVDCVGKNPCLFWAWGECRYLVALGGEEFIVSSRTSGRTWLVVGT